jgi:kanamycin nucleotidyltransferase
MALSRHVRLAATIAAELHRREGRNLVAVGVYGSVARGKEREYSDIDLLVMVRRKRRTIHHFFRDGILVTILQQTPEEARDEVTGSRPDLNVALGGWTSMRPLYDPSGLLRRLREQAKRPTSQQFREAAGRAFLEAYEDLGKLWNAISAGDSDEAREMAIWFSGAAMGALFDMEGHVLPTGRRAFVELRQYGTLGASIRRLSYETMPLPETLELSERIWAGLLRRASRLGIELPPFPRHSRGTL